MFKFLLVLAIVVQVAFAQFPVVCWPHPSCPPVDLVQTFFPHIDCGKFYKCNKGIKCEMNCPAGLHWSVKLVRCEWPNIACCDPRFPCDSPIPTPPGPIPTIPVPPVSTTTPGPITPGPGPIPTIPVPPITTTGAPITPGPGPIPTIPVPPVRIIY